MQFFFLNLFLPYFLRFKDAQPLIEFHDLASRSTMGPDGSLLISPTIMTDLGEFECKIRNLLGEEENAKAYLNVQCKINILFFNITSQLICSFFYRQSQSRLFSCRIIFTLWKASSSGLSLPI